MKLLSTWGVREEAKDDGKEARWVLVPSQSYCRRACILHWSLPNFAETPCHLEQRLKLLEGGYQVIPLLVAGLEGACSRQTPEKLRPQSHPWKKMFYYLYHF